MDMEQEVQRFRMEMLRRMPFYGDVMIRLPFAANKQIRTARTNGYQIEYNPAFLESLNRGQRQYVLLHEMLHVMLLHCSRRRERDPALWNTAADLIVNATLDRMRPELKYRGIEILRPPQGIFGAVSDLETVEDIYEGLRKQNDNRKNTGTVRYLAKKNWFELTETEAAAPEDLIVLNPEEASDAEKTGGELWKSEKLVQSILRESLEKSRSELGSFFVPREILKSRESRRLNWKKLLRNFLTEELSEESSYFNPERKYIHMDMILPGHSREECGLEEIWAFVDSSGSIGAEELEVFLTQLSQISREFKCVLNICYWDTEVTDVYRRVTDEKKIWESLPLHSGGTDINCVYRWLRKEKLRPPVMLILTDGYFGRLEEDSFLPSLKRNTILVLSTDLSETEDMRRIGKLARL